MIRWFQFRLAAPSTVIMAWEMSKPSFGKRFRDFIRRDSKRSLQLKSGDQDSELIGNIFLAAIDRLDDFWGILSKGGYKSVA